MRLLIDTHVLIWWTGKRRRIPVHVRSQLADISNDVFVSAVSAWEIAVKIRQGKLVFSQSFLADFDAAVAQLAFTPIVIEASEAIAGAQIASPHKDPFDRMLAGQASVGADGDRDCGPGFRDVGSASRLVNRGSDHISTPFAA